MLDLIAQYPALYRWSLDNPRKPTLDMEFGSLFDSYIFDLVNCLNSVVIAPNFNGKGSVAARAEWKAENVGRVIVDQDDWDKCRFMGEAIHKHPIASKLLAQCTPQVSIFWTDPATGLECKARLDGEIKSLRRLLDLKTSRDASPDGFAKSAGEYRYHVQDAFYSWGYEQITGDSVRAFTFIVVEKSPPYPVATYSLDDEAKRRGRELFERDLTTLKRCFDLDEWPGYGEQTKVISLKPWYLRD